MTQSIDLHRTHYLHWERQKNDVSDTLKTKETELQQRKKTYSCALISEDFDGYISINLFLKAVIDLISDVKQSNLNDVIIYKW